jgi:IS5 family transposase
VRTTLHHPSESGLLLDSVRVLSRLVKRAKPLVQEQMQHVEVAWRSRLRRARKAAQALHRLVRRTSETKEQAQRAHEQKLLETAEHMMQQSERAARRLREQAVEGVPVGSQVIAQTRSRVLEGKQVASTEKVLRLCEPQTRAIPRDIRRRRGRGWAPPPPR